MTIIDESFIVHNEQYGDGIALELYGSEVSIVRCKAKDNEDGYWLEWIYPQARGKERKPLDKTLPWKISLGMKPQAIQTLKQFLAVLEGDNRAWTPNHEKADDDIPF